MSVSRRGFLGLVGGAGSVGLAGCNIGQFGGDDPTPTSTPSPVSTPWPMVRNNPQLTGTTDAAGPTAPVTKQWTVHPVGIPTSSPQHHPTLAHTSPTVVGSTVYVGVAGGNKKLHALSIADGSTQWRYDIGGGSARMLPSPAVTDDAVYVMGPDGQVSAFDPAEAFDKSGGSGEPEQWSYETKWSVQGSPTVADGTVYIPTYESVVALDAADGTVQWQYPEANDSTDRFLSRVPAVANDTVYVGVGARYSDTSVSKQERYYVSAVAADDGTERWRYELGDHDPTSLAVANDTLYVITEKDLALSTLFALAANDGTEQWITRPIAMQGVGAPAVTDDAVYIGSYDGHLYAYDAEEGTEQWRYPPVKEGTPTPIPRDAVETPGGPNPPPVVGDPVVAGDTVYVERGNHLLALRATDGIVQWVAPGETARMASPAVVDNTIYLVGWSSVTAITAE